MVKNIQISIMTPKIISTFGKKCLSPSGPPTSANALNAKVAIIAPSLLIITEEKSQSM